MKGFLRNVKISIRENPDYATSLAVVFNLYFLGAQNIFSQILSRWSFNEAFLNYASAAFIVAFYLYVFFRHKIYRHIRKSTVWFLLISFGSWLLAFLVHPSLINIPETITSITNFFYYSLLPIIFLPTVKDKHIYFRLLISGTRIFSIFVIGVCTFSLFSASFASAYSMTFGSHLLLPVCVMCCVAIKDMKISDIIILLLEIIYIIMYASRYPLLCIATSIIVLAVRYRFRKSRFRGLWILLLLLVVSAVVFFICFGGLDQILSFMNSREIDSRTLTLLLSGNISSDSGRGEIHDQLVEEIIKRPLLGYGSFGGIYSSYIHQPHGLIYDMLASFGILGTCLLIFLVVYRTIKLVRGGKLDFDLVLVSACTVLPIAFIQMGFWSATRLWIYVAAIL